MKASSDDRQVLEELPVFQRLLVAHAPADQRAWQMLCWQLDQRLAAVIRRASEPMIAAIRLAWWDEVLVADDRTKGSGEPLVERWRAGAPQGAATPAERLIDGWRLLAAPEPLTPQDLLAYAAARGGGMFSLLAGQGAADTTALTSAGSVWALWDLAAHVRDPALAAQAMDAARGLATQPASLAGKALRPLRLAQAVVRPDALAGKVPTGFTLRHYGCLLRAALLSG